jgi:DNA-binding NtrC family response regulator
MPSLSVLVIDDEPALRQILASVVTKAGYSVDTAATAGEATAKLKSGDIDVALCDIKLPDGNGIDLLRASEAAGLDTVFVMVTAFASLETAVEALRAGAYDYIVKPVRNEEILHRLAQIDDLRGLRNENVALRKAVKDSSPPVFRFNSPKMQEVERMVSKVAPTDSTVLIVGESGTGKGVLAHTIHELSHRCRGPFVAVNCSAIPEQLLESEFFGHTKGAFTGADRARKGLFIEAERGTLFLDEIGELPIQMQTKLLHVIEDKQVRAVGSEQARHVDCRIIAATNRNLLELIEQGKFREDLYFRLSVFQIPLPPLRERQSDIPGLVRFLLAAAGSGEQNARPFEIDPEAETCLLRYGWPGNVRELDNVIKRARILAEDNCITVSDLPAEVISHGLAEGPGSPAIQIGSTDEGGLRTQVRRFESELIRTTIAATGGDRKAAARKLGISLSSLYGKIAEHGLK